MCAAVYFSPDQYKFTLLLNFGKLILGEVYGSDTRPQRRKKEQIR